MILNGAVPSILSGKMIPPNNVYFNDDNITLFFDVISYCRFLIIICVFFLRCCAVPVTGLLAILLASFIHQ
jgi:hypothetical protein